MEISPELLAVLLSSLAAIVLAYLTGGWKVKYDAAKKALRTFVQFMDELDAALEDDNVTADEWMELYKRALAFAAAVRELFAIPAPVNTRVKLKPEAKTGSDPRKG